MSDKKDLKRQLKIQENGINDTKRQKKNYIPQFVNAVFTMQDKIIGSILEAQRVLFPYNESYWVDNKARIWNLDYVKRNS